MKNEFQHFGLVIAFLLPGFICLYLLSFSSDIISLWLAETSGPKAPTVGGFLYATLASLALGLLISAIRWALVDHALALIGIKRPNANFQKLTEKEVLNAFLAIVDNHYRYYQYYSNTLMAFVIGGVSYILKSGICTIISVNGAIYILIILFLCWGSKDCLQKYYDRTTDILGGGTK